MTRLQKGRPTNRRLIPDNGEKLLSSTKRPDQMSTSQPSMRWILRNLSPGTKRPKRRIDHSSPSSVEIKNAGRYNATSKCAFMVCPGTNISLTHLVYFSVASMLTRRWADKSCLHCNIFIYIRHIWIKPVLCSRMVSLFHHTSP